MKNKFKIFDRGVFVEAINRLKIPGIIGSAIFLSSGFILVLSCLIELFVDDVRYVDVPAEFFYITLIIPFVIVPMMMMSAFSYLRARKTSDFYHALPLKRETMYFSTIFAALAWIVALIIVASIIPLGFVAFGSAFRIDMSVYWPIIARTMVSSVFVLSCFALGVSLTGNGFSNFFVPIMIAFVPRIVILAILAMLEGFTPFLVLNIGNTILSYEYNILFGMFDFFGVDLVPFYGTAIYSIVVSLIYLVLGAVAFKKRKSEMAGKSSAFTGVQFATRMILPFIALLGSLFFVLYPMYHHEYDIEFYFFSLALGIVAFTIYFLWELITIRQIRKVVKSLVWFPVLIGGVVVVGIIISIGSKLALARNVDEDKIKYITVKGMVDVVNDDEYFKVYDEDAFELIADAYNEQLEEAESYFDYFWESYPYDVEITVGINQGGITFYRNIYLESDDYLELKELCIEDICDEDFVVELPPYSDVDISVGNSWFNSYTEKKIYNTLRKEIKKIPYIEVIELMDTDDCYTTVRIDYYSYTDGYRELEIPISKNTPETLEVLIEELSNRNNSNYYNNDVYADFLEYYEENDQIEMYADSVFVLYDDGKEHYTCPYISATLMPGSDYAKETVEIFRLLEESHDSRDGDNVIIMSGWMESYAYYDEYEYTYSGSASLDNRYYVTDDVVEKFIEYLELIQEVNDSEYDEEYYEDDYYYDY